MSQWTHIYKSHSKGLLTAHPTSTRTALGTFSFVEYEMPLDVHSAWCWYLAKDCDEDV